MKKLYSIIAAAIILPWISLSTPSSMVNELKVADPEPGYLCVICPRCCKERELEDGDNEVA